MSQAENLLDTIYQEGVPATLSDEEPHIIVREDRTILVPLELKRIGVQHDHNVETVTFDCVRYWDEHDLSAMYICINFRAANGVPGRYPVTDATVDSENPNIIHFTWTIGEDVTQGAGKIAFSVCIRDHEDIARATVHWNSETCNDMYVSPGLETMAALLERNPDILTRVLELADKVANADDLSKFYEALASKANGIIDTSTGEVIALTDSAEAPLTGLVVYGKSTQDGTPTPDAPVPIVSVGEDGVTDVGVCVANLIRFPYHSKNNTSQGITWTINKDGSVTANGTATANSYFALTNKIVWHSTSFNVFDTPKTINGITFSPELNYNSNNRQLYITVESGETVTDKTFYPMANYGNTLKPYEPYKLVHTIPVSTPDGLCGIPVTSGGNYTDASGQQWVCDEIDFARGVRVQRIGDVDMGTLSWHHQTFSDDRHIFSTASLDISNTKSGTIPVNAVCELYRATTQLASWVHGDMAYYGTVGKTFSVVNNNYTDVASFKAAMSGVRLLYELETPIETPLTEEELAAYRALQTNYQNTTIYADDNAGLSVGYSADTKLYIDKKFAELAAAIVNN